MPVKRLYSIGGVHSPPEPLPELPPEPPLPPELPLAVLEKELIQEAIGLGPLEYLLERDDITEIMVNGPGQNASAKVYASFGR